MEENNYFTLAFIINAIACIVIGIGFVSYLHFFNKRDFNKALKCINLCVVGFLLYMVCIFMLLIGFK